ncbi:MAG: (Fe-S)-binding protein [Planctomycetes bacterium]|nr:(Fe-S)-binding protein [Planctomycetota bacterium]
MRVSLFLPCLVDQFSPTTARSVVRVLRHVGVEVDWPREQTCCGQPAFNAGYRRAAARLAERFLALFAAADAVVAPSGSCVAMVRHHFRELDLSAAARAQLRRLDGRVYEFTEFLTEVLGKSTLGGRWRARVAYHPACHLLRGLGVDEGPRRLLRGIAELELVELPEADTCCGFGGAFAVKFPELSAAMAERKCRALERLGVEHVVSADSSCLMQLGGYLSRHGMAATPLHIADLLARSLGLA